MQPKKSDLADVKQNLERLKNAPSYRMSTRDPDFLERSDGRTARLLSEFLKAEKTFEHENIASTIIVFGSARILEPKVAQERRDAASKAVNRAPDNKEKAEALKRAEIALELSEYYQIARE
ncbi:MAG: 3-isopropylmalate dehydrogenase, partial [Thermoguttaceae bacterium]|nr:3-isopropylmalate dehydrogenase [Thermoguttaceae bacterium]